MASVKNALKPALFTLVFLIIIGSLTFWLWQRQPSPSIPSATVENPAETIEEKITETQLEIAPASGSVLNEKVIRFNGKTIAGHYVLLLANNTMGVTKADENGQFEIEAELIDGLNLLNVVSVDENLAEKQNRSLTLYVDPATKDKKVLAGSVKSIFDDLITVTGDSGEQTIRQKSSTGLTLPEGENAQEDSGIRVGDFLIVLGSLENEKEFSATLIEIIRENKPQNIEKYVAGQIASNVNKNIFSVNDLQDSKLIEFTLNKETTTSAGGQDADKESIVKDKKAIIFYFVEDNEKIADLIYLLP